MLDWREFLTHWSRELVRSELASRIDPPAPDENWLGFDPATDRDISVLEDRLGLLLPPSYRLFLQTSNGWRRTTFAIGRIRPAAEVNWFRIENEGWVDTYSEHGSDLPDIEYFDYSKYAEIHHRAEHMQCLIQISDVEDGVYLLNPEAVTPDGEWEAWFFASSIPGAHRYPSFAHLMTAEYESFRQVEQLSADDRFSRSLTAPPPSLPRVPAERVSRCKPKPPAMEELIRVMSDEDDRRRAKAVRTFHGKLRLRARSQRRPDLIAPLSNLFYASKDPHVRAACVAGMTSFAEDDAAPAPLLDALSDPDAGVFLIGAFALSYFPNPDAVGPLCRFIESRANVLFNETAMHQLAELGDDSAIPTLRGVLLDTTTTLDQSFATAACALARLGTRAFDVLAEAATHPDPRVRRAATVGLDVSSDPRAASILDRLESDEDAFVSKRAKTRMGKWPR